MSTPGVIAEVIAEMRSGADDIEALSDLDNANAQVAARRLRAFANRLAALPERETPPKSRQL